MLYAGCMKRSMYGMAHATTMTIASDTHGCTEQTASTNILRFVFSAHHTIRVFVHKAFELRSNTGPYTRKIFQYVYVCASECVCEQLYNIFLLRSAGTAFSGYTLATTTFIVHTHAEHMSEYIEKKYMKKD